MKSEEENKTLPQYTPIVKKNTELFSIYSAETLIDALKAFCAEKSLQFEILKDKYKVVIKVPGEETEVHCKILSYNEDTNCLEVNRTKGGCMHFYEQFNHLRDFLGDLVTSQMEVQQQE